MNLTRILLTCAQHTPFLKNWVAPVRPENRMVFIGGRCVEFSGLDAIVPEVYCDNTLTTSKYTAWNFIFKNLYEQFIRIANFYFLIVAVIMLCVPNTPVSFITSALPLGFVLLVNALKQAYEDWLRHKEDKIVNSRTYKVIKDGKLVTVQSHTIQVGDIVRVEDREQFPCDLVLLSSSDAQGHCTIQTANLDGETNLKTFLSLPETRSVDTPEQLDKLQGYVDCQQPITDLYKFLGNMTIYNESPHSVTRALQSQNVLLSGAKLKNTDYIYGCAIYTGHDTKLALNSIIKSGKRSCVERKLNTFLIILLAYLVVQCGLSTLLRHLELAEVWRKPDGTRPQWYIPFIFDHDNEEGRATSKQQFIDFLYFYIIYNYVIPISLYVTIELQKFVGSIFFGFDIDMYDECIDERAKANTSDLNEELGQVEYLFCDKTGTLTENEMQFRQCSINGELYTEEGGSFVRNSVLQTELFAAKASRELQRITSRNSAKLSNGRTQESMQEDTAVDVTDAGATNAFFEVLSLCHTVQIDRPNTDSAGNGTLHSIPPDQRDGIAMDQVDGLQYEYHASSPDEKALVEACRMFGIVFHGSKEHRLHVTFHGQKRSFTLHQVLEFDSDRKCMSVVIENDKGEYQVLCKGAESSVLKKCIDGPIEATIEHVDYYASLGLRTLVIASKSVDAQEFHRLMDSMEAAKQDLTNRDKALVKAFEEVEQGLTVIGATAVEDKLQVGVKETIEKLRQAGIKIWVLTGDKEETAVNISHSAGHFDNTMSLLGFTMQTSEADAYSNLLNLKESITGLELEHKQVALVVDGSSFSMILTRYIDEFREICLRCSTVLCCRMTPIQKAEVVKFVKESASKPTTAAIGDGANDVSMIQEAHVGIGIMGKEGRQAARSSDYAFGKFRFLLRTLLVHGHYYYLRLAILVQYSFYKNVAFITANFYFTFFSAYSAMSIYDTIYLTLYNVTFTSLPVYLYGLFEQSIPADVLLNNPTLYRNLRKNHAMNFGYFALWNISALWHSVVASFGIYLIYLSHGEFGRNGLQTDIAAYGTAILFICTTAVNVKLMTATYYWTWITVGGYAITFIANWGMIALYSKWPSTFTPTSTSISGVVATLFSSGVFWLTALILLVISILPDIVVRAYNDITDPVYVSIANRRPGGWCCATEDFTPRHVMFSNSNESISISDAKRNDVSVINHRYLGDGSTTFCGIRGTSVGGGQTNLSFTVEE